MALPGSCLEKHTSLIVHLCMPPCAWNLMPLNAVSPTSPPPPTSKQCEPQGFSAMRHRKCRGMGRGEKNGASAAMTPSARALLRLQSLPLPLAKQIRPKEVVCGSVTGIVQGDPIRVMAAMEPVYSNSLFIKSACWKLTCHSI